MLTAIFDSMMTAIISLNEALDEVTKYQIILALVESLKMQDWDTEDDSMYRNHEMVDSALKASKAHEIFKGMTVPPEAFVPNGAEIERKNIERIFGKNNDSKN